MTLRLRRLAHDLTAAALDAVALATAPAVVVHAVARFARALMPERP